MFTNLDLKSFEQLFLAEALFLYFGFNKTKYLIGVTVCSYREC